MDITIKMRRPFADMDYYGLPPVHGDPGGEGQPRDLRSAPARDRSLQVRRLQAGHQPDPGQERPVGPEHRPGPHPDGRRLGVQVRPGHRQAREHHPERQRLGADHAHLRQRERLVVPPDRAGQGAPGHRDEPVHVHVVPRHDEGQGHPIRQAIGYAYPYVDAWKAAGEIVGVTRVPGTAILPPGTAGRKEFDVLGTKGEETDPERARQPSRRRTRSASRSSSCSPPTTTPPSRRRTPS